MLSNALEDFKNYWAGWQSIATIVALALGGYWTWRRFLQFREGKPKISVALEIYFIRKQAGDWLITVEAPLKNESKVRYEFRHFALKIGYAVASDKLENKKETVDGKDVHFSTRFPNTAVQSSWLEDAEDPDDRLDYGALEPGESDRWLFAACIPANATIVRADCELLYDRKNWWEHIVAVVRCVFRKPPKEPESQQASKVIAVPTKTRSL
jgi:hypothetical protein